MAALLRPLIDQDLSVVFYDLTTIRAEGMSEQEADVRRFGMSKEGIIARQFMLGVVQTQDGMPIYHEVFDGNAAEAPMLQPTLKKVLTRHPHIRRLVVVADRGLLSLENIEALSKMHTAANRALEFILAVPSRHKSAWRASRRWSSAPLSWLASSMPRRQAKSSAGASFLTPGPRHVSFTRSATPIWRASSRWT